MIHYYLTVFPTEALIASQLEPDEFGTYMATGTRRGTAERLIFIELDQGEFGSDFDWAYAAESCRRAEAEGHRRRSAYLGVYRVLERVPNERLGALYLVTRDGRSLSLQPGDCGSCDDSKPAYLYQELCPAQPMVVSRHFPCAFIRHITDPQQKISMPRVAMADMRMVADLERSDSGTLHYRNVGHLRDCVASLGPEKAVKVVDRSTMQDFEYNHIATGIYVGQGEEVVRYAMPPRDEILREHYEWARSAQMI